jgi:hypothetical protein
MVINGLIKRKLLWVCAFILTSCNAPERAMRVLGRYPLEAAQFCSLQFPVNDTIIYKDSVAYDTVYAVNLVQIDTIYKKDTTIITVSSPAKTITKRVYITKEVIKEPTQKIEEQRQLYLSCEARYQRLYLKWEQSEEQKKDWRSRFWWVLFVAIGAVIGYFTKQPFWAALAKQLGKKLSNDKG